jgi:hypothetical protein
LLAKDIRYIKTQVPSFSNTGDRLYNKKGFLLAQLLAPAMIIAAYLFRTARDKAGADPAGARARSAMREAQKRLEEAGALAGKSDVSGAWKAIGAAMRGYVADISDTSAMGLTMEDVASSLRRVGAGEEAIAGALSILESCDAASFSPRGRPEEAVEDAIRLTRATIDGIEKARSNR